MKFITAVCIVIVMALVPSLKAARICVIQSANCNTTTGTNVCGRYGRSTLCMRFRNTCALQTANCTDNVGYTAVSLANCRNIALNQRAVCGSSSTSSSNVQPVIVNLGNTGK
ncbi:uncharacterized protein LOC106088688 [Stomoxys calcitrans]|uniref:uncharacterized protein LOC106088688 n=1 Tax=Stomoxys calcitrans TaxID=35570 RepID=UPI0027E324A0|nr:uncharacterized protein LOC106088688 [Stomoxys calcitrans]